MGYDTIHSSLLHICKRHISSAALMSFNLSAVVAAANFTNQLAASTDGKVWRLSRAARTRPKCIKFKQLQRARAPTPVHNDDDDHDGGGGDIAC